MSNQVFMKYLFSLLLFLIKINMLNAQVGYLDTTFATNGVYYRNTTIENGIFSSIIPLKDGKILGILNTGFNKETDQIRFIRFLPDGKIDTAFNPDTITPGNSTSYLYRTNSQSNNEILIHTGRSIFRINTDGKIDTSFGIEGEVKIDTPLTKNHISYFNLSAKDNNKIAILGVIEEEKGDEPTNEFFTMQLNENGTVDKNYGNQGIKRIGRIVDSAIIISGVNNTYLQQDKKLLISAEIQTNKFQEKFLIRLKSDGTIDSTFNKTGYLRTTLENKDFLVSNDSKINIFNILQKNTDNYLNIIRYLPNGTIDVTFGQNGMKEIFLSSEPVYLGETTYQNEDKILIQIYYIKNNKGKINLIRLLNNGVLDNTFGNNGISNSAETEEFKDGLSPSSKLYFHKNNGVIFAGSSPLFNKGILLARYNLENIVNSIEKQENDNRVKVYPNPSRDVFHLQIPNEYQHQDFVLDIFDAQGRKVIAKQFSDITYTLSQNLTQGIYYYILFANGKKITAGKWIKINK